MKEFNEFFETDLEEKNFSEEEEVKHFKRVTKIFMGFIIFFILLFLILGNVKAEELNNVTFPENVNKVIELEFNQTFTHNGLNFSMSQTGANTFKTCVNDNCEEYTIDYNIHNDTYNFDQIHYYVKYGETNNIYTIIFGRIDISGSITQEKINDYVVALGSTATLEVWNTNDNKIDKNTSTYSQLGFSSSPIYCRISNGGCNSDNMTLITTKINNFAVRYEANNDYLYSNTTNYGEGLNNDVSMIFSTVPIALRTRGWNEGTYYWWLVNYNYWYQFESTPVNYYEIYNSGNLTKSIHNFDIYFTENETSKMKVEFSQESGNLTDSNFYTQRYYGKKCNNNTCYWEEIQNGGINVNVTRTLSEIIGNRQGGIISYDYDIDMTGYEIIKMAILVYDDELLTNYSIKLYSLNENTSLYTDLNYISYFYNRDEFKVRDNYISVLIQLKDTTNSETYYNWSKAYNNWKINEDNTISNMDYLFPYTYRYNLNNYTIIDESIDQMPSDLYNSERLNFSQITLSNTQALYLGMYYIQRNYDTYFWNYFTDKVYYTISNDLNFTTDYNNNSQIIITTNAPNLITSEYTDAYEVDLSNIQAIILSYYDKKDNWLQLFYSIYDPMPQMVKNILIIGYTILLSYGIFLIFKD